MLSYLNFFALTGVTIESMEDTRISSKAINAEAEVVGLKLT